MVQNGLKQGRQAQDDRPSRLFLRTVSDLLVGRVAEVRDLTDVGRTTNPVRGMIGYMDEKYYYLNPGLSFTMVSEQLRKSGMEIRAIYASKYHPETSEKKHQAVKTAEKLDLEVQWLAAGDAVPMGDSGAVLRVLAPEMEIPGNEDDNSLVMMLESPDGRMLLAGDMERIEEAMLLSSKADLKCDVLKVPNHADSDACSKQLIQACGAQIAVISTSTKEKPETPDSTVLKNLKKAGCEIYVTQDCTMGVRVTLSGGQAHAEYVDW